MESICKIKNNDKYWVIPNTEKHELSYKDLGVLHNENDAAIKFATGTKQWFYNGLLHRTNGPAIEYYQKSISWYLNDELIKPTDEMMEKYIRLNPDNILKYHEYPLKIQKLAIKLKPNVIFNIPYPHEKLKQLYPQLYALKDSGLI